MIATEAQGTLIAELAAAGYPGFVPVDSRLISVYREVDRDGVLTRVRVWETPNGGTIVALGSTRSFVAATSGRPAETIERLAGRLREAGVEHLLHVLEEP